MTISDTTSLTYRRAIRDRLADWISGAYGTRAAFQRATNIDNSALGRLLNSKDPQVPSGANLGVLAKTSLSLDYLFTGEGPENRGTGTTEASLAEQLREYLVMALERRGIPIDTKQLRVTAAPRRRGQVDARWDSRTRGGDVLRKGKPLLMDVVQTMEEKVLKVLGRGVTHSYVLEKRRVLR